MRARLDQMVGAAMQDGSAVPALTCYDFTTALAVVEAAEQACHGVILLVPSRTGATANGLRLIAALRGLADEAAVPVALQLDHAVNLRVMADAVAAGADSILADGSALPYEDNIAFVLAARAQVGPDVVLEAELGGLPGDEDKVLNLGGSGHSPLGLTDPARTGPFVSRTGPALLAVAVGNVHGRYTGVPQLRWDLLRAIAETTDVPLVLHGASGIPSRDLIKARSFNVGKINFNTELRTRVLTVIEDEVSACRADGENIQGVLTGWSNAARVFAGEALAVLSR